MDRRIAQVPPTQPKIFSGNSNLPLSKKIAKKLKIPLGKADIKQFSDGEIGVEITENVRGIDVVIIQSTCAPTNDNLMELLIMVDAFRRSSAASITILVPYYGYARQDRRPGFTRTPITSRMVADMIQVVGVDNIMVVDIHSEQQQGFFNIPMTNLSAFPVIVADIWRHYSSELDNVVIVSPDTGGVVRARSIAKQINDIDLAIIDKRRPEANQSIVMNVIGDVKGKTCIIVDDMIDTAGTLCKGAAALKENGAGDIIAYATHGVFSGNAINNIENSALSAVVVADTIPLSPQARKSGKIRSITVAGVCAEAIRRMYSGESVSEMYI